MSTAPLKVAFVDLQAQYRELKEAIDERIRRVLEHGQFILGPEVAELERELATFAGSRHCITCASGTDALLIALMALGIRPGDEVITPAFTFIATAEVAVLLGATPIFVDVDERTCNLDARKLRAAFTSRTRAVIPVSLYGQPPDMAEINAIAREFDVPVIEDAAQSFGALYRGRRSCNLSLIGCTSFFPSKPLGCYGDGGAIFTDDERLAEAMSEIRVHGQSGRYVHTRIGIAGRMDTLQCAIVLAKLARFPEEVAARQAVAGRYARMLAPYADRVRPVEVGADRTSVFAQYTVRVRGRASIQRRLEAEGIPTAVHYPTPIFRQAAYERWVPEAGCPAAEAVSGEVLSLPMHAYLDAATQERIAAALVAASLPT